MHSRSRPLETGHARAIRAEPEACQKGLQGQPVDHTTKGTSESTLSNLTTISALNWRSSSMQVTLSARTRSGAGCRARCGSCRCQGNSHSGIRADRGQWSDWSRCSTYRVLKILSTGPVSGFTSHVAASTRFFRNRMHQSDNSPSVVSMGGGDGGWQFSSVSRIRLSSPIILGAKVSRLLRSSRSCSVASSNSQ